MMIRKVARFKNSIQESFPVSELHNSEPVTVSESQNWNPLPSQDCYNKNLNLNKIKESFKKDESILSSSKSFENEEEKENAVLHDLDMDKEKGLIPYLEWLAIRTHFVKRKSLEELYSKDELLKSYYESKSIEKRKEEEKDLVMAGPGRIETLYK